MLTRATDTILRAPRTDSLSLEEMRARLPAIFATEPHESRSDRYVYVSTEAVLMAMIKEGFAPVEARVSRCRDAGRKPFTKHMVRLRHQGDQKNLQVGDTLLEVFLRNAHDGTAAYELGAGLFKLLCLNGMTVAKEVIASVYVRHSGNEQKQIDAVVNGAYQIIERAPLALEAPRVWPTIDLIPEEEQAFAEAARVVRFGDSDGNVDTSVTASQLLHARRPQDQGSDLWKTFNRVQENSVKGGLGANIRNPQTGKWRRSHTREVKSIDGDLKLNRALWLLASEMAKLKQAA
jgi:hypothetical protein